MIRQLNMKKLNDDDLPLNKPIKFPTLTIISRCFTRRWKILSTNLFRQVFVWVLNEMIKIHRIEDSKRIVFNRIDKSKKCKICCYNYFDDGFNFDWKVWNEFNDWGINLFGSFAIMHVNRFSYRFFMFNMSKIWLNS